MVKTQISACKKFSLLYATLPLPMYFITALESRFNAGSFSSLVKYVYGTKSLSNASKMGLKV